jgi:hypothetical protein
VGFAHQIISNGHFFPIKSNFIRIGAEESHANAVLLEISGFSKATRPPAWKAAILPQEHGFRNRSFAIFLPKNHPAGIAGIKGPDCEKSLD